jgi:IS30 family transposase
MISKQLYEAQLQQIFRLLLENKTQEEIARELNISTRTVARYYQRIEKRYGKMQRQKTDNTLFTEAQLFKHRMLNLYKALENSVLSENTSGIEKAKCAEIAANIAIDVLRMESEGIKAVKELVAKNVQGKNILENLHRNQSKN